MLYQTDELLGLFLRTNFFNLMAEYIQTILSLFLILLYPFEVVILFFCVIGFVFLLKWKNPSKVYYYFITIFNVIGFIFQDVMWSFISLIAMITGNWLTSIRISNFTATFYNANIVFCVLSMFLRDVGPMLQYWTTCVFGIHRMLIVMYPFKVHIFQKVFNKWILILLLTIIASLYIPDLFIVQLFVGKLCRFMYLVDASFYFWKIYYGQIFYISNIAPFIINCISLIVITKQLSRAAKMRLQFATHIVRSQASLERRSLIISVSINIIYIIGIGPSTIIKLINTYIDYCSSFELFTLYNVLFNLNGVLQYNQMFVRITDGIIFYLMIPEFRKSILNSIRCHVPTYAALR